MQLTESTCSISDRVNVPDPFLSKQLRQKTFRLFWWAHFKASMICPSWFSSSTILLIMSRRFGSFKTPLAFGSTWIVKSSTKDHQSLMKPPAAHSLLGWSWVAWGCLPKVLSSPAHWSRCQTFWTLPEKFSFSLSTQTPSIKPDTEKSVFHWGTSPCPT